MHHVGHLTDRDWAAVHQQLANAAFPEARDFLVALGFQTPRADAAHAFLWRQLQNGGQGGAARGGTSLRNLGDELVGIELIDEAWATLFAWE